VKRMMPEPNCGVFGSDILFSEYIERLEEELSALKRFPKSKLQRYSPYSRYQNMRMIQVLISQLTLPKST
jgi:hypothetical protein